MFMMKLMSNFVLKLVSSRSAFGKRRAIKADAFIFVVKFKSPLRCLVLLFGGNILAAKSEVNIQQDAKTTFAGNAIIIYTINAYTSDFRRATMFKLALQLISQLLVVTAARLKKIMQKGGYTRAIPVKYC